jgi:hypothetical protein
VSPLFPDAGPTPAQRVPVRLSATCGAPTRRAARPAPDAQAALLPELERLPNGEPAALVWEDMATGGQTTYSQAALW